MKNNLALSYRLFGIKLVKVDTNAWQSGSVLVTLINSLKKGNNEGRQK